VRDSSDDDDLLVVQDRVDDAVVSHSDSVVASSRELDGTGRARLFRERVDRRFDAVPERRLEPAKGTGRCRMQPNLYARTSDQGTAASPSSRAWSAARLSSR
jgi:hypothetical protein